MFCRQRAAPQPHSSCFSQVCSEFTCEMQNTMLCRYFCLMENVKHLLSAEMRPLLESILKAACQTTIIVQECSRTTIEFVQRKFHAFTHFTLFFCATFLRAGIQRAGLHRQMVCCERADGWHARRGLSLNLGHLRERSATCRSEETECFFSLAKSRG